MEDSAIPLNEFRRFQSRLEKLESVIRAAAQKSLAILMQRQVERAVCDSGPTVALALSIPTDLLEIGGAKLSLIKATRHCPSKPILVVAYDGRDLVGRCTVPQVR